MVPSCTITFAATRSGTGRPVPPDLPLSPAGDEDFLAAVTAYAEAYRAAGDGELRAQFARSRWRGTISCAPQDIGGIALWRFTVQPGTA